MSSALMSLFMRWPHLHCRGISIYNGANPGISQGVSEDRTRSETAAPARPETPEASLPSESPQAVWEQGQAKTQAPGRQPHQVKSLFVIKPEHCPTSPFLRRRHSTRSLRSPGLPASTCRRRQRRPGWKRAPGLASPAHAPCSPRWRSVRPPRIWAGSWPCRPLPFDDKPSRSSSSTFVPLTTPAAPGGSSPGQRPVVARLLPCSMRVPRLRSVTPASWPGSSPPDNRRPWPRPLRVLTRLPEIPQASPPETPETQANHRKQQQQRAHLFEIKKHGTGGAKSEARLSPLKLPGPEGQRRKAEAESQKRSGKARREAAEKRASRNVMGWSFPQPASSTSSTGGLRKRGSSTLRLRVEGWVCRPLTEICAWFYRRWLLLVL